MTTEEHGIITDYLESLAAAPEEQDPGKVGAANKCLAYLPEPTEEPVP